MKWRKIISRGMHPVLLMEGTFIPSCGMFGKVVGKVAGFNFNIKNWLRFEGSSFVLDSEYKKIVSVFNQKIKAKPEILNLMVQDYFKLNQKTVSYASKISPSSVKKMSSEQLKTIFKKFLSLYNPSWSYTYVPWMIEDSIGKTVEKEIAQRAKKYKKQDRLNFYLELLARLPQPTYTTKEKEELSKIIEQIRKNPKLLIKKAKEHQKKYQWLPTYLYQFREYSLKDIITKIKRGLKEKPQKTIDQFRENKNLAFGENLVSRFAQNRKNLKKMYRDLHLEKRWQAYIEGLQKWVWIRTLRIEQWSQACYFIKPVLEELGRRMSLSYQEVTALTREELFSGKFNHKEIKQRLKGHAHLLERDKHQILTGKELQKIKKEMEEVKGKVKEIKGTVANPGYAKGKVRLATAYTFDKIKKGDIVVTGMTTPEATVFLEKAKAIVTDEGGLTCHAAIISREINKPCIIGTKIATSVFKDGDLVEVDAEKGLVKKI